MRGSPRPAAHCPHTFAAKAATIRRVLELLRECAMGCEVASPVELAAAFDTLERGQTMDEVPAIVG